MRDYYMLFVGISSVCGFGGAGNEIGQMLGADSKPLKLAFIFMGVVVGVWVMRKSGIWGYIEENWGK